MKSKIVARAGKIRLWFDPKRSRYKMTGGRYGEHHLYAQCYTDRVDTHWRGYMENNGINWWCHPEYFPHFN